MPHWRDFLDIDAPAGALLPWKRVEPRVGISRSTAWRLQKRDDFPSPYVVSPGRVAYLESEVEAWKASRGRRGDGLHRCRRQGPAAPSEARLAQREPASWSPPPPAPEPRPERPLPFAAAEPKPTVVPKGKTSSVRRRGRGRAGDQMMFEF